MLHPASLLCPIRAHKVKKGSTLKMKTFLLLSAVVETQCLIPQDTKSLHHNASRHFERKRCPVVTLQHGLVCHEQAYWNCCATVWVWDSLCYMLYACMVWKCMVCYADTGICCVTLLCLLKQTYVGCWELRRSEGVGPDYDGEAQQWAGAVVHGQMVSDHLQVHNILPRAWQRLG